MKKVLFTAKVDSHIINFHIPYLKWFKEKGYEVYVASNGEGKIPYADVKFNLEFDRNPLKPINLKVYKELKKMIDDNGFEIIHCHTPIGGALTRMAARKARKRGTKVIYTAHGFHFLKGGSKLNWMIFYPIEKFLSRYTDCLITINNEDYEMAKKNNFKAKEIKIVNGVGVDLSKYYPPNEEEKEALRKEYGFSQNDEVLIYVAELNGNKHQDILIKAVKELKNKFPNIKLLLVGDGVLREEYKRQIVELGMNECISMLGQREDVEKLLRAVDIAVSTSRREGLPKNIMEAMATGLPIVVSDSRGNRDLIKDSKNGFVVGVDDEAELISRIEEILEDENLGYKLGSESVKLVRKYSLEEVLKQMEEIYKEYILV